MVADVSMHAFLFPMHSVGTAWHVAIGACRHQQLVTRGAFRGSLSAYPPGKKAICRVFIITRCLEQANSHVRSCQSLSEFHIAMPAAGLVGSASASYAACTWRCGACIVLIEQPNQQKPVSSVAVFQVLGGMAHLVGWAPVVRV